jgi:glycosyltransferase involved in cell wall biosynthesis
MNPRVLHLSTTDLEGGAARGSYWLHRALVGRAVDSTMLVERKHAEDDDTVLGGANGGALLRRFRACAEELSLAAYRKTDDSFWSVNWVPSPIGRAVERLAPDIIHIHWSGGGFLPIETLARLGRPIVWTLRDMWPFTGGCHYTAGCDGYRHACGNCPQLRSSKENDISRWIFDRKRRHWRGVPLHLVPISSWLAEAARSSPLFRHAPIEVIPNGLDTSKFTPADRQAARHAWNLPADRRLVLFGAINATKDPRKGFRHLCKAIRRLGADGFGDRGMLAVFGADGDDNVDFGGVPVRYLGHVEDDRRLAQLYAAADVMVAPSLQEAFGKTLIEAMACATPVVAFDHGGPSDIVVHRETGYLARAFCHDELADGIAWCLDSEDRRAALGRAARARAETEYDIHAIAGRYEELYRRIAGIALARQSA